MLRNGLFVLLNSCLGTALQFMWSAFAVLLSQACSEGRKEHYWFTDSTNKTEAEAGVKKFGHVEGIHQTDLLFTLWENAYIAR